jgi:membrane protease YdiL (CAAX protease family)
MALIVARGSKSDPREMRLPPGARRSLSAALLSVFSMVVVLMLLQGLLLLTLAPRHAEYVYRFSQIPQDSGLPARLDRPTAYPEVVSLACGAAVPVAASEPVEWQVPCSVIEAPWQERADDRSWWGTDLFAEEKGWSTSGLEIKTWQDFGDPWSMAISLLPSVLLALFLGIRVDWHAERSTLKRLPWHAILHVPLPWLVAVSTMVAATSLGTVLGWFEAPAASALDGVTLFGVGAFALLLLWAPVYEELIFRGWFARKLDGQVPRWVIALSGTGLFTLAHVPVSFAMPYALPYLGAVYLFSLCLYWLRWRHGSLSLCMAAHMLNNAFLVALLIWIP